MTPNSEDAINAVLERGAWLYVYGNQGDRHDGYLARFASEAARACLVYGFGALALRQIVSFTAASNLRSQAVMQRIGMRRQGRLADAVSFSPLTTLACRGRCRAS